MLLLINNVNLKGHVRQKQAHDMNEIEDVLLWTPNTRRVDRFPDQHVYASAHVRINKSPPQPPPHRIYHIHTLYVYAHPHIRHVCGDVGFFAFALLFLLHHHHHTPSLRYGTHTALSLFFLERENAELTTLTLIASPNLNLFFF